MKNNLLKNALLISVFSILTHVPHVSNAHSKKTTHAIYSTNPDVSLRYHAQWTVDKGTQKKLHETYGTRRISFDPKGRPIPKGLSADQIKRWERLYDLCMSDGCYYCDAAEGSCESNTCGVNNEHCKPHVGTDGQPICGKGCADYAFMHLCQF